MIATQETDYVVVCFYTSSCKGCAKEVQELTSPGLAMHTEAKLLLVSLDSGADLEQKVRTFWQDQPYPGPFYHLPQQEWMTFLQKEHPNLEGEIPLSLIYTKEGRLVEAVSFTDPHEIEMIIHQDQSFRQ